MTIIAGAILGFLVCDPKAGYWNILRVMLGTAALVLSYYAGMKNI